MKNGKDITLNGKVSGVCIKCVMWWKFYVKAEIKISRVFHGDKKHI